LSVVRDITDRQRAAEALRESEKRFRIMADSAPVMIWMSGADKLCTYISQGWLDFTGHELEQELGNGWVDSIHCEDRDRCVQIYSAAFDKRLPFRMEYRLRRRNGEFRWIVDQGIPRWAPTGEFLGYIGSALDITERKLAERALQVSEERYREVVESQTDLVCRYLPDTTLTFVNEAYCRFFGLRREELIGRKFLELIPESARNGVLSHIALIGREGGTLMQEHEAMLPDGRTGWQHWVSYAIFAPDGRVMEFQGIGRDITDRKRAEEARQNLAHASRLVVVGELTAMIAHEVNQPLGAILSNADAAEILLESKAPPLDEIRQILVDIRSNDLRASEAIRRIRALLQKREMEMHPLDVNETVADVLRLVTGDALRRRVQIRKEFTADLPMIRGDRVHLQQVLLNLIVNSMDAMAETADGNRQICVRTMRNGDNTVEVAVEDAGHGIPANKLSRVFDSFFTTKKDGMGLGLSIARSIIEAHQGHIWAENNSQSGVTFRFTLPFDKDKARQHPVGV
jgi:PAS domain S-box-containing protein